jgi:hypothetical protein
MTWKNPFFYTVKRDINIYQLKGMSLNIPIKEILVLLKLQYINMQLKIKLDLK